MAIENLDGKYKELWIEYQNSETVEISSLTYDQLNERIEKWEAIEFEARAKRQKDLAERRSRDEAKKKAGRDALISDPHYSPTDSPSKPSQEKVKKETKPRLSKEDKLKSALGDLGINLGDLLADIQKKKTSDVKDSMVNGNGKEGE